MTKDAILRKWREDFVEVTDIGTPLIGRPSMSIKLKSEYDVEDLESFLLSSLDEVERETRKKIVERIKSECSFVASGHYGIREDFLDSLLFPSSENKIGTLDDEKLKLITEGRTFNGSMGLIKFLNKASSEKLPLEKIFTSVKFPDGTVKKINKRGVAISFGKGHRVIVHKLPKEEGK